MSDTSENQTRIRNCFFVLIKYDRLRQERFLLMQILTSDSSKTSEFFILFFLDVLQSFTFTCFIFIFIFLFSDDNATTFVFSFLAFSFFEVFGFSSSSSLSEDVSVSYLICSYSDEVSESELTLLSTRLELFCV